MISGTILLVSVIFRGLYLAAPYVTLAAMAIILLAAWYWRGLRKPAKVDRSADHDEHSL